jgi:PPK2 family polyphosphate:nucleotide phosphotransferase
MRPILFEPVASPYLVSFDGGFRIAAAATAPPDGAPGKKDNVAALETSVGKLSKLQRKLYADDSYAVLLVFQAMDAAGKDGTIRAVLSGVNPAGCQVFNFKAPSSQELDHDFLWRHLRCVPERGRIGVWNRSHYEEVLVVRVKPHFLDGQKLPYRPGTLDELWAERYDSIRDVERHLARSGVVILKFFLHVSPEEQRDRLLDRIDDPSVNWKFEGADLAMRRRWGDFMRAYEDALNATSRPWAPWYAIPADSKPYMRRVVSEIVVETVQRLDLQWPEVSAEARAEMLKQREDLAKS